MEKIYLHRMVEMETTLPMAVFNICRAASMASIYRCIIIDATYRYYISMHRHGNDIRDLSCRRLGTNMARQEELEETFCIFCDFCTPEMSLVAKLSSLGSLKVSFPHLL